jgi:hypothetical protein
VNEDQLKFLTDQFKESGSHARHLENLRAQHMAFFFTVLLTSIGVAATLLKDQQLAGLSREAHALIAVWLWLLIVLAILVLTSIKKLGYAHDLHSRFTIWTRQTILGDTSLLQQMFGDLGDGHRLARSRLFSVQFTNEAVVVVALLVLDVTIAAWIFRGGLQDHWTSWLWVLLTAITLPLFWLQCAIYYVVGVGKAEGVMSLTVDPKRPEAAGENRAPDA